jgi:cytochrome c-type biogenesis protein
MTAALFVTALVLGALSFYEPCTIATHTLFAARAHAAPVGERRRALVGLVASRCALLAALLGLAAVLGPVGVSASVAVVALGAIGAVYLVTRRVYLPVPHVEVYRLVPGRERLPEGVRLGLTLPACTLPLVAITAALAAVSAKPAVAAAAGALFGAAFSAPTIWHALTGLDPSRRAFLSKAAATTPYLTTALLWGGAAWVWQAAA